MIPTVITDTDKGREAYDIYSRLLKDRIVFCTEEITTQLASSITAQLLFLESEDREAPVTMYITSPGGDCYAGIAIINMMNHIACPVSTVVNGFAASMATVIASSGTKGKRYVMPDSRIMMHMASSNLGGNIQDVKVAFEEFNAVNNVLIDRLALNTGKSRVVLIKDMQRDDWLYPADAIKYGLVDEILK